MSPRRLLSAGLSAGLAPAVAIVAVMGSPVAAAEIVAFHETNVLGTSLDLAVNAPSREVAERVRTAVLGEVNRLEAILSAHRPDSELGRLNRTLEPTGASAELIEVLSLYDAWRQRTRDAFSGQLGDLMALWAASAKAGREPADAELSTLAASAQQPLWSIDRAANTVTRTGNRAINVDSLGKGYIVSRALVAAKREVPEAAGILLNIGGDISATGSGAANKNNKWTVSVADPAAAADNGKPLVELRVSELSVATSGHGARGFAVGERTYSHIIDPRTGRPVRATTNGKAERRGIAAVTVIAADNPTANALATSICVLGVDAGLALIKDVAGAECLIVLNGGGRVRSDGFKRFEIPNNAGTPVSTIALSDGDRWPERFVVDVTVPVKDATAVPGERPYVAIWVEDDQQQHVKTLCVWGDDQQWLKEMDQWWRAGKTDLTYVATVTRPTRAAGRYQVAWDGTDRFDRRVPQGKYTVWVEVAYEHGDRLAGSAVLDCAGAATAVSIGSTDSFDAVDLRYDREMPEARP